MENYPKTATERFDNANLHIKYCLSIIKKYIKGNKIEVGAGCGSFTRRYYHPNLKNIILTEKDLNNINSLSNISQADASLLTGASEQLFLSGKEKEAKDCVYNIRNNIDQQRNVEQRIYFLRTDNQGRFTGNNEKKY